MRRNVPGVRPAVTVFTHKLTVITASGSLDTTTTPDLERLVAANADTVSWFWTSPAT